MLKADLRILSYSAGLLYKFYNSLNHRITAHLEIIKSNPPKECSLQLSCKEKCQGKPVYQNIPKLYFIAGEEQDEQEVPCIQKLMQPESEMVFPV